MSNLSGVHPKGYAVLVQRLEVEETTESGIVLAQTTQDKENIAQNHGILIEAGSFAWSDEPEPRAKIGDMVLFGRYKGEVLKGNDGIWYRVMNDKDIIAVVDKPVDNLIKSRDRSGIDNA